MGVDDDTVTDEWYPLNLSVKSLEVAKPPFMMHSTQAQW
jgi:hypothetical protein